MAAQGAASFSALDVGYIGASQQRLLCWPLATQSLDSSMIAARSLQLGGSLQLDGSLQQGLQQVVEEPTAAEVSIKSEQSPQQLELQACNDDPWHSKTAQMSNRKSNGSTDGDSVDEPAVSGAASVGEHVGENSTNTAIEKQRQESQQLELRMTEWPAHEENDTAICAVKATAATAKSHDGRAIGAPAPVTPQKSKPVRAAAVQKSVSPEESFAC